MHLAYRQSIAAFEAWLRLLGYSSTSVYNFPRHVAECLGWLEGKGILELDGIGHEILEVYLQSLTSRENKRQKGGLSAAYLNKHIQALKLFGRYLKESGQGNMEVKLKAQKSSSKTITIIHKEAIDQLYKACGHELLGLRDKAMLGIYYGCGLRRNEGIQLNLRDVHLQNKMLYVRKGKNYKQRFVPISKAVAKDLALYLKKCRPKLQPLPREKAFFLSAQGTRLQGRSMAVRLDRLCKKANINQQISLHSLRHAIATHLLDAGMELQAISRFLGHSSLEATQIYTHPQRVGVAESAADGQ